MIVCNVSFDLLEALEVLKDAVLEDSVELVLDRSQHRVLVEDVEAELIPRGVPV